MTGPPTTQPVQRCVEGEPMMHGDKPYRWCVTHNQLMLTCEQDVFPAPQGGGRPTMTDKYRQRLEHGRENVEVINVINKMAEGGASVH